MKLMGDQETSAEIKKKGLVISSHISKPLRIEVLVFVLLEDCKHSVE